MSSWVVLSTVVEAASRLTGSSGSVSASKRALPRFALVWSEADVELGIIGLPDPNYVELALHGRCIRRARTHKAIFVEKFMIRG